VAQAGDPLRGAAVDLVEVPPGLCEKGCTPSVARLMEVVLIIISTTMGRDYLVEGKRTMRSLGLDGRSAPASTELDS
jgi:hypothetical protein